MSRLVIEDLRASYGRADVLHGINISIPAQSSRVVLGANGAGKTTLLRSISGLVSARGSIRVDGFEIIGRAPHQIAELGVSHVPQGRGTIGQLTVEENLLVGGYRLGRRSQARDRMQEIFSLFPVLDERRTQKAGQLSGGEQQMLAIGRALMPQPRLLLLDEPSLGLAPLIVRSLFTTLADLGRFTDASVLLVEQNAGKALDLADDVDVIEAGVLVAHGTPDEIRNDDVLRRAYLGA